jgi:hypothetical protein
MMRLAELAFGIALLAAGGVLAGLAIVIAGIVFLASQ